MRFVVLGMQRSGTTVTLRCLAGHPDVAVQEDEVMASPFFTSGLTQYTVRGRESFTRRHAGHRHLFDAITAPAESRGERAFGIKVAVGGYEAALDAYIGLVEHFPDAKLIVTEREDTVAQFASRQLARHTGRWHRHHARDAVTAERLHLGEEEFTSYADECRRIRGVLDRLQNTHDTLRFGYERHVASRLDHRPLFEFLGLTDVDPDWVTMRKISPPVEDVVTNLGTLRAIEARTAVDPLHDPAADVLDRISAHNAGEDSYFLLHRAHARLERGWLEPAKRDLRTLVERSADLDAALAGRAHAYAEYAGIDGRPLAAGREADGQFLFSRGATLAIAGRARDALAAMAEALERAPGSAKPEWVEPLESTLTTLSRRGNLDVDAELGGVAASQASVAAAVIAMLAARVSGDPARTRSARSELERTAPALLVALRL